MIHPVTTTVANISQQLTWQFNQMAVVISKVTMHQVWLVLRWMTA